MLEEKKSLQIDGFKKNAFLYDKGVLSLSNYLKINSWLSKNSLYILRGAPSLEPLVKIKGKGTIDFSSEGIQRDFLSSRTVISKNAISGANYWLAQCRNIAVSLNVIGDRFRLLGTSTKEVTAVVSNLLTSGEDKNISNVTKGVFESINQLSEKRMSTFGDLGECRFDLLKLSDLSNLALKDITIVNFDPESGKKKITSFKNFSERKLMITGVKWTDEAGLKIKFQSDFFDEYSEHEMSVGDFYKLISYVQTHWEEHNHLIRAMFGVMNYFEIILADSLVEFLFSGDVDEIECGKMYNLEFLNSIKLAMTDKDNILEIRKKIPHFGKYA